MPSPLAHPSVMELDSKLVQQTKAQIRDLVAEISRLGQREIDLSEYLPIFMRLAVEAMMADGIGVWLASADPRTGWRLVGSQSLDPALTAADAQATLPEVTSRGDAFTERIEQHLSWLQSQMDQVQAEGAIYEASRTQDMLEARPWAKAPSSLHQKILDRVAQEKQPVVVPPQNVPLQGSLPVNPTEALLILAPVPFPSNDGTYWIEVVQPAQGGPATQRGYLRFVAQLADFLGDYLRQRRLRYLDDQRCFLDEAEQWIRQLSDSRLETPPSRDQGSRALAEQVRQRLKANQVFFLSRLYTSSPWRVHLASSLPRIDARSDGIEIVQKLAGELERYNRPCPQLPRLFAQQDIHEHLTHAPSFAEMFESDTLLWIPLHPTRERDPVQVAALAYWYRDAEIPSQRSLAIEGVRTQSLCRLSLDALRPPWWSRATGFSRGLGLKRWVRWKSWSTMTKSAVICACAIAIALIPCPIHIIAPAILRPAIVQHVYAPTDAIVRRVHADHGQVLTQGAPLLELEDRSLTALIDDLTGQQNRLMQRARDVDSQLRRADQLKSHERDSLEAERQLMHQQLQNLGRRLELTRTEIAELTSRCTQPGVVATWNARHSLENRPVRAGQLLLTVFQPDGPWNFEATISERDLALWHEAQSSMPHGESRPLQANFQLISHPNVLVRANLVRVDGRIDHPGHGMGVFRATFQVIDDHPLPARTDGAAARMQLACGKSSLIWVLARDFLMTNWARLRLWI